MFVIRAVALGFYLRSKMIKSASFGGGGGGGSNKSNCGDGIMTRFLSRGSCAGKNFKHRPHSPHKSRALCVVSLGDGGATMRLAFGWLGQILSGFSGF